MYDPDIQILDFNKDVGATFKAIITFDFNTSRLQTCDIGPDTSTAAVGAVEAFGAIVFIQTIETVAALEAIGAGGTV
jgi:hypothetical protein